MDKIDIIIHNGIVVTMDNSSNIINNGAIIIQDNKILDIGESKSLFDKYHHRAKKKISAFGKLILPGFINLHTHSGLTILRGVGDEWATFPSYTKSVPQGVLISPEDMRIFTMLGGLEALRFGTTCIVDNYIHGHQNARAFSELKMRAVISERIHDADLFLIPEGIYNFSKDIANKSIETAVKLIENWHGNENGKITCRIGPHATDTCSIDFLQECRNLANKYSVGLTIHLAQSSKEVQIIKNRTKGLSPVELLKRADLLGNDLIAAHCIFVNNEDIEKLSLSGTHVSYQPEGNAKYGLVAPIEKMRKADINIGLGTDNMTADMVEVMRFAVCMGRINQQGSGNLSSNDVIKMATINGARALGLEDQIGSLEVGKKADLILIDFNKPHMIPIIDPLATLVHSGLGSDIDTVIVDGEILIENGNILIMDEKELLKTAHNLAVHYWKKIGGRDISYKIF